MKSLVGERRAIAAAVLAFYGFGYMAMAFLGPGDFAPAMTAMASVYALGFFGLVAGYFWARWYSIGLGLSGLITSVVGLWQMGAEPVLLFMAATHAAAALTLWGDGVAALFDGRTEWRTRFHLDEHATNRLGKAVIRIGISLPYILLYALAPKPGQGLEGVLLALGVLGFAGAGTYAVLRMRSWGLLALGAAATTLTIAAIQGGSAPAGNGMLDLGATAALAAGLLGLALLPFARPVADFLRRR
jgi:hypothetical protein